jgi:DNA glycosylase AlkZ-like
VRPLTLRELNRTLLARQLLLERRRLPAVRAVGRLVAMQAQYAPSPYVALWSRLEGFRKEHLTRALVAGTVVKAGVMRGTLHLVTRELYPFVVAAHIEAQRGRVDGLGTDPWKLFAQWPDRPMSGAEAHELAGHLLRTDDRWRIAFTLRALPWVRLPPVGEWPHHKPSPDVPCREPLAPAAEGASRVVRDYLAAYGPAAREDVEQFTGFRLGQIDPALAGLRQFEDEQGRVLFDLPRRALAATDAPAPVRFLPAYDSIILAHRDRSRILPQEYTDTVLRRKNATTLATFTVDGFIAGAWKADRVRGCWKVTVEPFAPLPRRAREEVDVEAERLAAFYAS